MSTTRTRPATDALTRDALAVLQPGFRGTTAPDWVLRRLDEGLAAVAVFGRNVVSPEQLAALTAQLRAVRGDVLVAVDEEGGDVTRLEVRTGSSYPGNLALGAVDDPDLTRAVAHDLGGRLAACGINLNWAPCADVNSDPGNPVIGVRSFGATPALVARHTAAWIDGLQSAGVAACTKHFPGHGDTAVDSHHDLPRVGVDLTTLRERELVPFRAAVAAGTRAVMSAHILLPALDPERPATLSPAALHGLLRAPASEGGLGFDGLIVTDGIEMRAISAAYGIERGSVLALAAGADALCVGGGLSDEATVLRLRDALVRAVHDGDLPEERLADAAARVRALAEWARGAAAPPAPAPGAGAAEGAAPAPGLRAARRALRRTAREPFTPLDGPVHVAAFTPVANIAVGDETPWGVAAELTRLLPGTTTTAYGAERATAEGTDRLAAAVLTEAGRRRVVAVVRDAHRHPWMAGALTALVAARPDTVVVEMGVPQAEPCGALHLATHGAARVCARAAAEALTGTADG
ncbi:glycoside hydrolase family 3 protein [Streptomyces catenulae]|uniref:Glycoside hydrolase family 3 N-terminal domain-containing protein n=1 Tax=Streptomyces catenulae TaxID=66875 RepID=A0ABV2YW25_9ACTN|nr:glycoside hydrolase family 3 N-terminal domain-containing protein [Streptomyces catenulae]